MTTELNATPKACATTEAKAKSQPSQGAQQSIKKNNIYQVSVDALSHEGRGIASLFGQRIFIEGALVGEQVSVKMLHRKKKVWNASVEAIHQQSPLRQEPPCQYAAICGGCSLQHMHIDAQRAMKQHTLQNQLRHFGQCTVEVFEPILTSQSLGYRKKARLGVRHVVKKAKVLVGFREKNAPYLANMDSCEVIDHRVGHKIAQLQTLVASLAAKATIPQIEVAASADEVALIFRHLEPLSQTDQAALIAFAQAQHFQLYLQPGGHDSVHRVWPVSDHPERLYYTVDGLKFAFHPQDFTQVNSEINEQMIARAMAWLDLSQSDDVLDLFCGLGNFTLPLAKRAGRVIGLEGAQTMVDRGYENAQANSLTNVDFYAADLFAPTSLESINWSEFAMTKVLLDPPRSGAESVCHQLVKKPVQRIVYVSCNPATLSRDTAILQQGGFRCVKVGVMDMFAHTHHMESIALFERSI